VAGVVASTDLFVERLSAVLAIIAAVAAVSLTVLRFVPAAQRVVETVREARLWLAALVAVLATAGSLYFSEVAHFTPCKLCWLQRVAMYPLSLILVVAAIRRDTRVRVYVLPIAVVGGLISTYHYVIERRPSLSSGSCDLSTPCTVPWFEVFGFISLALMALSGFAAIVSLLTLGDTASHPPEEDE
jgi:disulfide bond formation protein DsbB